MGFGLVDSEKDAAVAKKLGKWGRVTPREPQGGFRDGYGKGPALPCLMDSHAAVPEGAGLAFPVCPLGNQKTGPGAGGKRGSGTRVGGAGGLPERPAPLGAPGVPAPATRGQPGPEPGPRMWVGEGGQ